ncbi:tyrosine-type recombinase/integrase [Chitinophaga polysaccharea]|uniref:tyrosine-type recombinase/integrase n=1 Tax=Chitinophaga polysaccharea TaxID=1293035 RepID=UPI001455687C|nr:tyrosine-type recombinase/integrase [Chitinophaga polysaccharea]NLR59013.1 tyrosine-type recombinase/integrase [Chitinophaga polysaccharea]NLR59020.1 tyrosine-type recombinase/integrase [Chitinophaga polysaccharea]
MMFTDYLKQKGHSGSTISTYSKYLACFTEWLEQDLLPADVISYTELLDFIRHLQSMNKSKALINAILCPVRHYFNYLVVEGKRTDNPATGLFIKGIIRRLPNNLLSHDEMLHLYECYQLQLQVDASKKIMLGLFIYQGVTVEELKRLYVTDIYLKEGKVFISGSSHSNERWLRLEATQVLELQAYIKANKFKTGPLLQENKTGKASTNNIVNQVGVMMRQLRQLNPKVIDATQLRSSIITHWLKQYNLRQVQYMAGHRYVSSTQRYKLSNMDDLQNALQRYHPLK